MVEAINDPCGFALSGCALAGFPEPPDRLPAAQIDGEGDFRISYELASRVTVTVDYDSERQAYILTARIGPLPLSQSPYLPTLMLKANSILSDSDKILLIDPITEAVVLKTRIFIPNLDLVDFALTLADLSATGLSWANLLDFPPSPAQPQDSDVDAGWIIKA